jgi:hypothetical protein
MKSQKPKSNSEMSENGDQVANTRNVSIRWKNCFFHLLIMSKIKVVLRAEVDTASESLSMQSAYEFQISAAN